MNVIDDELGIPKFSIAERDARWTRVRKLMERDNLDAIFVPPNTGFFDMYQANGRYLTGMGVNHAMFATVFGRDGDVTAFSSADIDQQVWLQRQDWVTDIRHMVGAWGFTGAVIDRLKELPNIRRLGVSGLVGNTRFPEGVTSHGVVERLREALPEMELVNANPIMEEVRFVKSDEEIAFLKAGVELAENALEVLKSEAAIGVPENVVYARMIATIVEGGGELPSMILWSAGNPQPPSNTYFPTRRKLRDGDFILTELEAKWGGYIAQVTQPLIIGPVPVEYSEMFALQQEVLQTTYDLLRPGETLGHIAERINAMGRDGFDCRILMHGRGLGDDSPLAVYGVRNETMANWVIEENSAFIIKPVVWSRDKSMRVYWGDTVVCTASGARRLGTRTPEIIQI